MSSSKRLMLKVPLNHLQLIRQLIVEAKKSLCPIEDHMFSEVNCGQSLVNLKYLNTISLDRAILAAEILFRVLPKALFHQKAVIYLSPSEFQTIMLLLKGKNSSANGVGKWHSLWVGLVMAELYFDGLHGPNSLS